MSFERHRLRVSLRSLTIGLAMGVVPPAYAQDAQIAAASSPTPATQFEIRAFQVKGNVTAAGPLLPPDRVERVIYPFMGPDRSEADVESARAALQKAYEDAGYPAVSVFVPEQTVGSGVLVLQVQPQMIGKVAVEGTRKPERIVAQAASLTPGETPNLKTFQRDVIAMNQKPSRKVTPEMRAGEAPGTLDVVLKVEDSSPFHGSAELNNYSSAATTDLRAAATIRYDDLWGRGDSISLSAQTAPRRRDDATVFSGNYLMHLGTGLQLLIYGVHSDSDIAVVGGTSVVGKGDMAGARVIASLGAAEGFYHSLTLGADWKHFKEDVILGSDRASVPITYTPISAAWRGDWTGDRKDTDLTVSTVFG
ncbi:MAG: POTRA domain-containing protein, partial [Sphingobium sp.]